MSIEEKAQTIENTEAICESPFVEEAIECDIALDIVYETMDYEKFTKGVEDSSYLMGQVSSLRSVGLDSESIMALITLNKQVELEKSNREHDLTIAKMQLELEKLKLTNLQIEELYGEN